MATLFSAHSEKAIGYARVAVERGIDRYPDGLTYAIPSDLEDLRPGERVIVPLGRGDTRTAGVVIDRLSTVDIETDSIKFIQKRDLDGVLLSNHLLEMARWISSYYCAPIGMTLATMLPAAVKKNIGTVRKTLIDLAMPHNNEAAGGAIKLSAKQKAVMEALRTLPASARPIELHALAEHARLQTVGPIKKLIERGLLVATYRSVIQAAWAEHAADTRVPERLTDEQKSVIEAISSQLDRGFSTHLLYGVTGSGKTEVYIRLIQQVVDAGKVALMLVPEISLTPQTGGRLIGRFPNHRVAILHSGLTAAQRNQQWALASEPPPGGAHIVLGARSAVFAPIPDELVGLIIIDEEHDSSYKQDQVPRYHGRDVAIRRAQLAGCPIVLGSATPSLESWYNASGKLADVGGRVAEPPTPEMSSRRRFMLHRLRQRAPGLTLPKVMVLDFREQSRQRRDNKVHLLGPVLENAIAHTLEKGGQSLILLNRRGYASYIACPSSHCGWTMQCDHCDVTVVYHRDRKLPTGGYVRCHHCLSEQKLPSLCPQCSKKLSLFGLGTQRIEEELTRKFPQLIEGQTLLRMDSDSMNSSRDYHSALQRFGSGEARVLLGTQMIAKGLDFPGVQLVGVINADTSINLPDFRASERTFQLVNQVAGRCGRGADPGLTIVQTFNPTTPAIQLAAAHDFETFARQELLERERNGLPPITRLCRIVVRDEDHVRSLEIARAVAKGLSEIAEAARQQVTPSSPGEVHEEIRLRGPAPCPISRIADKYRQQIEILAPNAAIMQSFLVKARNAGLLKSDTDMAIDIDPIALL